MDVSVEMSWYLGVKPARTTLSEEAMHSIMSGFGEEVLVIGVCLRG